MKSDRQRGQMLVEYAITVVVCGILAAAAVVLLLQFTRFGWWLLRLIGVGYP